MRVRFFTRAATLGSRVGRSAEAALRQVNEAPAALTQLFTEHGVAAADIGAFDLGKKIAEVGKEDDA
ncbi:MAG TPA: hypothetical protein DCW29_12225, partial [Janthinobacterium sp.]|nr:hypothetical protein [Janthinobacterium sp.]